MDKNQNALADRGWDPLNKNLLLHKDLRATMTKLEKSTQYHLSNEIVIPQSNSKKSDDSILGNGITTESEISSSFVNSNYPSHWSLVSTTAKSEIEIKLCLWRIPTLPQRHVELRADPYS